MLHRVGLSIKSLSMGLVDFYHERNIKVDTWAPGNAAEYAVARGCGVDTITTNDPDIILSLQAQYEQ
jgi:glycerophosphoryl diester phosphodiesterase